MILKQNGQFYIEAGQPRRKGVYNHRVRIADAGKRDYQRQRLYDAEKKADARLHYCMHSKLFAQYITVGIIDDLVSQDEYIRLFGSTRLLVEFSARRKRSEAFRSDGVAKISFHQTDTLFPLDIIHELAHTVTLKEGEPAHGERFAGAMVLMTCLPGLCGRLALAWRFCVSNVSIPNKISLI